MSDLHWLEEYRTHRSRDALEQLVRRHAGWVHALAQRRLGDASRADDVMQAVFLVLAGKPPRVDSEAGLSRWLFGVASNVARRALRDEARRRRREQRFAAQRSEASADAESMNAKSWQQVAPELDEAVASLSAGDREAILLRFYQRKTHGQLAESLQISEEAARQRVSRALKRLRDRLARRGIDAGALSMLPVLLEMHVAPPASAAVVATAMAGASGAAAASTVGLAKGAIIMAAAGNLKLAGFGVAMVLIGLAAAITVVVASRDSAPEAGAPPAATPPVATAPLVPPIAEAEDPNWRQRFDAIYRLEEGQVLKRVAPPFIPERLIHYRTSDPRQAEAIPSGPAYITFRWNGTIRSWGMGFGFTQGQTIAEILGSALDMKTYEFDGPREVLEYRLQGDWIVRTDAPVEQRLSALCDVIREAGGPELRFVQKTVPRQVVTARGVYRFQPMANVQSPDSVQVFIDTFDARGGSGGGSGTLDQFLAAVGSRVGVMVVNEATKTDPRGVSYAWHQSSAIAKESASPQKEQKIRSMLESLTEQTGLEFELEFRDVSVWIAEPVAAVP